MTQLKAVKPQEAKLTKPKVLIYGKPGTGKTWVSLDFPSTYYIDSESGANKPQYNAKLIKSGGVYLGADDGALDFDFIIGQVKALATEKHDYKTLVIDSISKVFNMAIAEEMESLERDGRKDEFGASRKKPVAKLKKLISWLSKIDMNVILVAHEKDQWTQNSKGERVISGTTFDCWDKLEYELDLVLNIITAGQNKNAFVRKSRIEGLKMGSHFPWSYQEFAKLYGVKTIERDVEKLDLATKEQLDELRKLFQEKDIPAGTEEKWFLKSNVSGWDEMERVRVDAAIEHIKQTY